MLNSRKIRNNHDCLEMCQDLARFIYPYPIDGKHRQAWWGLVCEEAGVKCEGEDLTLQDAMIVYAFLLGKVTEIFDQINTLTEQKVRRI